MRLFFCATLFHSPALTALVADDQSAIHLGKKAGGQYYAVVISAAL